MKKYLTILLCAVFFAAAVSAQEVSEKKEVAVFSLSYSDWSIPSGALGMVDQQIVQVITGLGRFDVKGLELRLEADDVSSFIDMVKQANESNLVLDEKYRLGEETFTEADFMELTGSFIIIIPSLTYYDSVVSDSGDGALWEVELQTAFSFISVKDSSTIARFTIKTYGSGDTQQEATMSAAEAVPAQLEFELRSIEEFRLKTGIIETIPGRKVIIELGTNMGISVGDEFSIVKTSTLSSGHLVTDNSGLLVISDVKNEISYGRIIYAEGGAVPGDQLAEIPRFGTDVSAYGHLYLNDQGIYGGAGGIKAVVARGFYDLRPLIGVEVPLADGTVNTLWPGLPLNVYLGGEMMWYLGRFQIEPSVSLGITGLVPVEETQEFMITHAGGRAGLTLNWMILDGMRLFAEGGYGYWYSIASGSLPSVASYGGIFAGLGVTFKL